MLSSTRCGAAVLLAPAPLSAALADATRATAAPMRSTAHRAGAAFVDELSPEDGDGAFTQAGFDPIVHDLYDARARRAHSHRRRREK